MCVCMHACGVLVVFAQLQVLFSQQTTSWSCLHRLISSSNTNVNEAQRRHSKRGLFYTCEPVERVHSCHCARCDFHTTPFMWHETVFIVLWIVLDSEVLQVNHTIPVKNAPQCVMWQAFDANFSGMKDNLQRRVTGKYYLMFRPFGRVPSIDMHPLKSNHKIHYCAEQQA